MYLQNHPVHSVSYITSHAFHKTQKADQHNCVKPVSLNDNVQSKAEDIMKYNEANDSHHQKFAEMYNIPGISSKYRESLKL
jgi:hypothetical protein